MGCDIHLHFEKRDENGIWHKIAVPEDLLPDDRDYDVFSFLAGVRNELCDDNQGQFAFLGIPKDTCAVEEDLGDHSFTHAYIDEVLKAPWKRAKLDGDYFYVFCAHVLPRLLHGYGWLNANEKRTVRVVMGFDS